MRRTWEYKLLSGTYRTASARTLSIVLSLILLHTSMAVSRPAPGSGNTKSGITVTEVPSETLQLSRFRTSDAKIGGGKVESDGAATCSFELPSRMAGQSMAFAFQGKVEKGSLIISLSDDKGSYRRELVELHGPVELDQKYPAFVPTGKLFLRLELAKGTVVSLKPVKITQFKTN
jgi:hypothetical protein